MVNPIMKKFYLFCLIAFLAGAGCLAAYGIIGGRVGVDGMLIEPSGLIPMGFLLIALGIGAALIVSGWALFRKPQKTDKRVFAFTACLTVLVGLYLAASFSYQDQMANKEVISSTLLEQAGYHCGPFNNFCNNPFHQNWVWIKTRFDAGKELVPNRAGDFRLLFHPQENTVTIKTDCNILSTSFTEGKDAISFGQIVSTKMFCEGSKEATFSSALQKVTHFSMDEDAHLVLHFTRGEEKGVMIFARGSDDSATARGARVETETAVGIRLTENEARQIAEQSCIKGEETLFTGSYNPHSRTWWFDASLNAVQAGCNPACVVSEATKTAEINWRCTGLVR